MVFMQYGGLLAVRNRRVSILQSNPLWGPRKNLVVPVGMTATALIAVVNLYGPGLQKVFDTFAGCKIIFFDAGTYYITNTLKIPAGSQVVGEGWSVIMGGGSAFQDQSNPRVMVRVGNEGDEGIVEITDIIFATRGPGGCTSCGSRTAQ